MKKVSILLGIIFILFFVLLNFPIHLFLIRGWRLLSSRNIHEFVIWIQGWGIFAPIISLLLMVLHSLVPLFSSILLTGANGIVFGIFYGSVISWVGAMAGATVSFYLSRWFGDKISKRLNKEKGILSQLEKLRGKQGFILICMARMIPFISFDLISYAAGFVKMRYSHFILATGLGIIPGTVFYSLVGHDIMNITEHPIRLSVILLLYIGLFYLATWLKRTYIDGR